MYLVFWGPEWTDPSQPNYNTYQDIIGQEEELFNDLEGSGYNGILTQYSDSAGPVINDGEYNILQDVVEDGTTPPSNIDQTQEAAEIDLVAQQISNWQTVQDRMVILIPQQGSTYADSELTSPGVCGYHYVTNDGNNGLYAMVPYLADTPFAPICVAQDGDSSASDPLAAAMTVLASHEYAEAVTDPWDNNTNTLAWRDQQGKNEIADLCAPQHVESTALNVNGVWVQDLWDNNDYTLDSTQGCDAGSVSFIANPGTYSSYPVFAEYAGVYGTTAIAANDILGVGYCACGGSYRALAEHYDGSSWQLTNTDYLLAGTNGVFMGVAATSSSNAWAAGNYLNTSLNAYQTLIEHYDGSSWTIVPSPNASTTNSVLYGIAALSATNVWAVGEAYSSDHTVDQALIEHYDGTSWSIVTAPTIRKTTTWLRAIAAVPNSNQVWAVGGQTTTSSKTSVTNTLVEEYNGTSWSVVPSTSLNQSPSTNTLRGVTAVSPTEILAVGNYTATNGTQQPIIGYYDGTQWLYNAPEQPNLGEDYFLTAVSVDPANSANMWVGGYMNNVTSSTHQPLLIYLEPDGSGTCSGALNCAVFFPSAADGTGNNEVMAMAVVDANHVWAMGKYDNYFGFVLADLYNS